jgi:FMN phosphatase YigB (HAD superfamily)
VTVGAPIAASAVGFDLGETLYHYRSAPFSWIEKGRPALDKALDAWGTDRSKADVAVAHKRMESYSSYLRERIEDVSAADVVTDALARLGSRTAGRLEIVVDTCFGLLRGGLVAYPDALDTLATLKQAGFKVGALTNVPFGMPRRTIHKDLEHTGLAPYVDGFVTSVDVGLRKPHRATFEWLAATLGVELEEIAYVGNLPTDVTGALGCGCTAVFLDRTGSGIDYGQTATVRHLSEIPQLLSPTARR